MSDNHPQRTMLDVFASLLIMPVPGVVETSKAAAESVKQGTGVQRLRILLHTMNQGEYGCTADELQHALNLAPQSCTPRCKELRDMGLLERTDVKRPTVHGRAAFVLRATPLAWQLYKTPESNYDPSRGSQP